MMYQAPYLFESPLRDVLVLPHPLVDVRRVVVDRATGPGEHLDESLGFLLRLGGRDGARQLSRDREEAAVELHEAGDGGRDQALLVSRRLGAVFDDDDRLPLNARQKAGLIVAARVHYPCAAG